MGYIMKHEKIEETAKETIEVPQICWYETRESDRELAERMVYAQECSYLNSQYGWGEK